jgi:outer membrane usher protein
MRRRTLPLIAWALLWSGSLIAQPDRMLLELCVNGSCYGTAFVVLEHEHVLVDAESLGRVHLTLHSESAQTIDGKQFFDANLPASGVKAQVDAAAGRLVLSAPARAFGGSRIDLATAPRADTAGAVPSAYVNYGVSAGTMHDNSIYLDTGFAVGRGLLRDNPSWDETTGFSRGLTRFEYDEPGTLARWTIGDQTASSSDGLGGSALLGGIGIARAFDLNPYLITYPQPVISGVLQAPGTVDIYENGVLVGQRQVPAGPFSLANLGIAAGANNVRVVVQDPFGGTTVLQQSFYGATQLLAPGLSDYAYEIGLERASTLANGYLTGRAVLLARDSYGFNDLITAGFRLEAENGLVNAGPSMSVRLPAGVLSAGVAGSHADGGNGYGASASYQYNTRNFSAGASTQIYSNDYLRIGDELLAPAERTRRVSTLSAAWLPSSHLSFQLSAGNTHFDDGSRQINEGLSSEIDLIGGARITLSFNHQLNFPGSNDNQLMLTFAMPLGSGSIGLQGSHDQNGGNSYGFFAQRSVPINTGFGYNVNVQDTSTGSSGLGQLSYQGQYGLAQLTAQRIGGDTAEGLLVSGSLVALDGRVYAGRALQNGYALVETPGLSNVGITSQNQPIGKTDANGNLIIYNLLPYQMNKLGIDQGSVPLDYQIEAIDELVSVPRLGGSIVRFDIHELHAAKGVLMLGGHAVKYGNASILIENKPMRTLIGLDGSFYFSDLPPGKHVLEAETARGPLTCPMRVPASSTPLVDLGKIECSTVPSVTR